MLELNFLSCVNISLLILNLPSYVPINELYRRFKTFWPKSSTHIIDLGSKRQKKSLVTAFYPMSSWCLGRYRLQKLSNIHVIFHQRWQKDVKKNGKEINYKYQLERTIKGWIELPYKRLSNKTFMVVLTTVKTTAPSASAISASDRLLLESKVKKSC